MNGVTAGWHDFFVAQASASATLMGLVFLAVSINLKSILEYPHLPVRVFEGLLSLFCVLMVSSFGLVPGQVFWMYGIEIGLTGLAVWAVKTWALITSRRAPFHRPWLRILGNQLPPLLFAVAGVLICMRRPSGIFWVAPGVLLCLAAGMVDVWVLLIEIKR
jgi:hypothetical protein